MRTFAAFAIALGTAQLLAGCVAPTGPVEVTRFHLPETAGLGQGTIAVEAAAGQQADSLEFRTFAAAVGRELTGLGYVEQAPGGDVSDQVAMVSLERGVVRTAGNRSPVSVGVGGSTGSYGSGLGLGIGFNLSPSSSEMVETRLAVTIRERASSKVLWEGRASFSARAGSPVAETQLSASRMAQALFKDFPGQSGETILVE